MVNYYTERLNEHFKDTSLYLDNLKPTKLPETIEGIADKIVEDLSPVERENLSNLPEDQLKPIQIASGLYSEEQLENMSDDEDTTDPSSASGPAKIVRRRSVSPILLIRIPLMD